MRSELVIVLACVGCGRGFFNPSPADAPDAVVVAHADAAFDGHVSPPIQYIQGNFNFVLSTAITATYVIDQRAGDLDVIALQWTGGAIQNLYDLGGNAYQAAIGPMQAINGMLEAVFIAPAIPSGQGNQVTVGFDSTVTASLVILEYANLDPVNPIDTVHGQCGQQTDAPDTGQLTATYDHDLMLAVLGSDLSIVGSVPGYTQRQSGIRMVVQDVEEHASGFFDAGISQNVNNGNWCAQLVALRGL